MELGEGTEGGCCPGFTPGSAIKILTVLNGVDGVDADRGEETKAPQAPSGAEGSGAICYFNRFFCFLVRFLFIYFSLGVGASFYSSTHSSKFRNKDKTFQKWLLRAI